MYFEYADHLGRRITTRALRRALRGTRYTVRSLRADAMRVMREAGHASSGRRGPAGVVVRVFDRPARSAGH